MKTSHLVALACVLQLAAPALAKMAVDVNAPASAKLGEDVTVSVKTDAKAHCKIEAQDAGMTQALKLTDKDADAAGKTDWKFTVPKDYKADKMPVTITVSKKGEKAEEKVVKQIEIKK